MGRQWKIRGKSSCLQLMCAVGGFVHPMSFFQQLEELFNRDTRVRWATQREDLPHQDAKRPPADRRDKRRVLKISTHTFTSFYCDIEAWLKPGREWSNIWYNYNRINAKDDCNFTVIYISLVPHIVSVKSTSCFRAAESLELNLHVALVCVHSVKQGFWCHPLHRQPSLQSRHGNMFFLLVSL